MYDYDNLSMFSLKSHWEFLWAFWLLKCY